MKILVVDNDKNTAETIRLALTTRGGYEVDVAYGGKEALEKMKATEPYGLLVLDIMMPELSGIDVCRLMAQDEKLKRIPVLMVSALPVSSKSFRESLGKFDELQVVKDILEKPFSLEDLLGKVKAVIGS
jgi:DNA-binding response OmpR family regulator